MQQMTHQVGAQGCKCGTTAYGHAAGRLRAGVRGWQHASMHRYMHWQWLRHSTAGSKNSSGNYTRQKPRQKLRLWQRHVRARTHMRAQQAGLQQPVRNPLPPDAASVCEGTTGHPTRPCQAAHHGGAVLVARRHDVLEQRARRGQRVALGVVNHLRAMSRDMVGHRCRAPGVEEPGAEEPGMEEPGRLGGGTPVI
eukprot:349850-Chlamydomonas_euryale.AAC.8